MGYQLPTIEVAIPMPHEPNRGVYSTGHSSASRVTIRTNEMQRELWQKWCRELGLSENEFIRAAAYNMARALEQRAIEKTNANASDRS